MAKKKDTRVPVGRLTPGRTTVKVLYDDGSEGQLKSTPALLALPKLSPADAQAARLTFILKRMKIVLQEHPEVLEI